MSEPVRLRLCQPQQLPPHYGMYIIMYICSYIASYVHVAIIHRVHDGIPVGSYICINSWKLNLCNTANHSKGVTPT